MKPFLLVTIAAMAATIFPARIVGQDTLPVPSAVMPEKHFTVFEKYCLDCHDALTEKGKVNLEDLPFDIVSDIPTAELWHKILDSLNSGEMPPEDKDQISNEEKTAFLQDLSVLMVTARDILSDSGGEITMRRLNRREYQNTMQDLLGLKPNVSSLPDDSGTGGFDTVGANLFFSSDQFAQYGEIASGALNAALKVREKPKKTIHRIEGEEIVTQPLKLLTEQALARNKLALAYLAQDDKPPTDFGFRDNAHVNKQANRFKASHRESMDYLNRPESETGAILHHKKNRTPSIATPKITHGAGGKYILRVRAGHYPDSPEREKYLSYDFASGTLNASVNIGEVKVPGTVDDPSIVEIPVQLDPGATGAFVIRQRDYQDKASRRDINKLWQKKNGIGQPPSIWIDYVELEGPFYDVWPNPVPNELLPAELANETEEDYARRIITKFATRAFREKAPEPELVGKLVSRYLSKSGGGDTSFEAAIDVYSLILTTPSFLYLREPRTEDAPVPLSDRELAIRLSYFLWSSPPDEELYALARNGTLSDPIVLAAQTSRLLEDSRSVEFVSAFAHQWLDMQRLDMFEFAALFHPEFDETVRQSARNEIYETIRHLIDEELPLSHLLKTDFVVIDDVLADFYGIPGVDSGEFQKVMVPADSPRGGLLGAAATHIMGSDGQRSSPVERGAWVLRHLLNDPPPPAPPNVPMLSRLDGEVLGARDLQKAHQEEAQCAQCHQKIDPIGYGMENFTAAGLWREMEEVVETVSEGKKEATKVHEFPIDPSGALSSGESFADYYELRDVVADYGEAFSHGFTEHLISYALGRPFGISDLNLAAEITKQAAEEGNTITAFVNALVQSKPFHLK